MDEISLWNKFNKDKPHILGAIFDLLSKAIQLYSNTKLDKLYRMADFTKWGYCIAEAYDKKGEVFLKQFEENRKVQNDELIESNPVIQIFIEYVDTIFDNQDEIQIGKKELLENLRVFASNENDNNSVKWINSVNALTRILEDYKEVLEKRGIIIEEKRSNIERCFNIRKNEKYKKSVTSVTCEWL